MKNFASSGLNVILRIADHEPLAKASTTGLTILPLYIVEPAYYVSRRHWHFIHDSLSERKYALAQKGAPLIIRLGVVTEIFENLRFHFGTFELFSHEETGISWTYKRDLEVFAWCRSQGISWQEFQSNVVIRRLINRDHWADLRNTSMRKLIILTPQKINALHGVVTQDIPTKEHLMFGSSTRLADQASLSVVERSTISKSFWGILINLKRLHTLERNCTPFARPISS